MLSSLPYAIEFDDAEACYTSRTPRLSDYWFLEAVLAVQAVLAKTSAVSRLPGNRRIFALQLSTTGRINRVPSAPYAINFQELCDSVTSEDHRIGGERHLRIIQCLARQSQSCLSRDFIHCLTLDPTSIRLLTCRPIVVQWANPALPLSS
jgi:hypothetical protein